MPLFFQQDIDRDTKLAIWKIEEDESFFLQTVLPQRNVSHPHKKLQHLAGRYILKYLFPDFPLSLIQIADTRKPFLEDEAYHFSISHCGDFAAAIASKSKRVGIDIEIPTEKVLKILHKFLHPDEFVMINPHDSEIKIQQSTLLWSAKEAMFKWWGMGNVDFSEMLRLEGDLSNKKEILNARFIKENKEVEFSLHFKMFKDLLLAWVCTEAAIAKELH